MPGDDRERRFEKALASHLRANRPAGADLPAEAGVRQGACPDAEILAAYHERLLAPEQMVSWKGHIATCSRCQEVLAHLEATDELPIAVEQEKDAAEKVLTMKEPHLAAAERAAGQLAASASPAALRVTTPAQEIPQKRRGANWRWLAPAGALAAGLLVWVGIRETHPPRLEMAKSQSTPVAAPTTPSPSSQPAVSSQDDALALKRQGKASPYLTSPSESRHAAAANKIATEENSRAAPKQKALVVPSEKTKTGLERDQLADKSPGLAGRKASSLSALSSGRLDAKKDFKEFDKQSDAAAPAMSAQPAPPIAAVAGAVSNAREIAKPAQDEAAAETKKEAQAAVNESVEVQTQSQSQQVINGALQSNAAPQLMRVARGQSPILVSAPNGKAIWRIGAAGIVEHSTNAGAAWTLQATGVIADLLAGSAPSDKVCWIVGRSGTILRTTDHGAHWVKVRSPVEDDLAAVFAVDAQQATVSTATSHKSYRTADGGPTWTQLTNP